MAEKRRLKATTVIEKRRPQAMTMLRMLWEKWALDVHGSTIVRQPESVGGTAHGGIACFLQRVLARCVIAPRLFVGPDLCSACLWCGSDCLASQSRRADRQARVHVHPRPAKSLVVVLRHLLK